MCEVAVNGVPRSGSTLVQQIVGTVLNWADPSIKVTRSHPGIKCSPVDYTFITIRHPFEVAASRYRVRLSRSPEAGGLKGMQAEIAAMIEHYEGLVPLYYQPHCLLRYELFVNDYDVIFNALASFMGGVLPKTQKQAISARYSLAMNRSRADRLADFNSVDDEGIHGDHIGGKPWREGLSEELIAEVLTCTELARRHGYAETN